MHSKKAIMIAGAIPLICIGIAAVFCFQMAALFKNTNNDLGLYYEGPRMDVVQFRKILEENRKPLDPGKIRINKIDTETGLPISTTFFTMDGVTTWQSAVEQPDGTYILYFEDDTPVKYRLKQENELALLTKEACWSSDPDMLRVLLSTYKQEAEELKTEWELMQKRIVRSRYSIIFKERKNDSRMLHLSSTKWAYLYMHWKCTYSAYQKAD